jgi:hypothetical protein
MSKFQKDGPKRRRYTRRELPYGQISLWRTCLTNFKREREERRTRHHDLNTYARPRRDAPASYAGSSEED